MYVEKVKSCSFNTIGMLSDPGGLEVTHPIVMSEVQWSIPVSDKDFNICFFVLFLLCYTYCGRLTWIVQS